jgi:hypothetical protein
MQGREQDGAGCWLSRECQTANGLYLTNTGKACMIQRGEHGAERFIVCAMLV